MQAPFPDGYRLWHKQGAMTSRRARKPRPPLDSGRLEELALAYVGRFATTRARLCTYLARKIRERGWDGQREPEPERIADRFAELGYIDDAAYALGKARALTGRGYGKRRVVEKLRIAGVDEADGAAARDHADEEAVAAALRFAQRRRLGPFAEFPIRDPREREKALAAMVRAGHEFGLSRAIVDLAPGVEIDPDELAERISGR
jgi:regulatory protein